MSITKRTELHEESVASVYRRLLADTTDAVYVVGPSVADLEQLIAELSSTAEPPVCVLAADRTWRAATEDFRIAGTAAELVAAGVLSPRAPDGPADGPLVITDSVVASIVPAGERVAGLTTADEAFVADVRERYADAWTDAEPFVLGVPPLSRIRATLAAELGPGLRADFDAALAAETVRRSDDLDETALVLLLAARNEVLLYDLGRWGEDVGFASRATFSRIKTRFEAAGLLDTEKVPIDVGRPRLRLLLGDERLRGVEPGALVGVARTLLSAHEA
jgi:hypothetical protein